ncbi:MAG TPA: peptidoglycan -binding protein [Thiotrichaceae bacterium]|jgi:chemotaxis protein MotB|nr:peptidoglycan -binding protein [Thiotrichaceae bacterium]HIM08346.1 peptidoglycan -binding protein [Gammaproteobacteria bacterium]
MTRARRRRPLDIWPAFVDATASLLMVVVFALLLTIIGHLVLSTALSGRDDALARLSSRISKLAEILSLEKSEKSKLKELLTLRTANLNKANTQISSQLQSIDKKNKLLIEHEATIANQLEILQTLKIDIAALTALRERMTAEIEKEIAEHDSVKQKLTEESELNILNLAQMELLNRQLLELQQQLSGIENALEIAEKDIALKQTTIDDLGARLNTALANKAQMLQRYRSEFFGRLRDALSDYPGIRIEGDRFVFPSELLFETGSAELGVTGIEQVEHLSETLKEISKIIPEDINWVLRIDGHTDKRPITSGQYSSNWELSSARAISIVQAMIKNGILAKRMAATGFAEHHPIDIDDTPEAYARNRRIELKLTSR